MKKAFSFINDYRDSFYYGTTIALASALCLAGLKPWQALFILGLMIWLREIVRWYAWVFAKEENPARRIIYRSISMFIFVVEDTAELACHELYEPAWWRMFFIGLNISILAFGFVMFFMQGVKLGEFFVLFPKIYWHLMFDWPRKQKPPKRKKQKDAKWVRNLLTKIAYALAPRPVVAMTALMLVCHPSYAETWDELQTRQLQEQHYENERSEQIDQYNHDQWEMQRDMEDAAVPDHTYVPSYSQPSYPEPETQYVPGLGDPNPPPNLGYR